MLFAHNKKQDPENKDPQHDHFPKYWTSKHAVIMRPEPNTLNPEPEPTKPPQQRPFCDGETLVQSHPLAGASGFKAPMI